MLPEWTYLCMLVTYIERSKCKGEDYDNDKVFQELELLEEEAEQEQEQEDEEVENHLTGELQTSASQIQIPRYFFFNPTCTVRINITCVFWMNSVSVPVHSLKDFPMTVR